MNTSNRIRHQRLLREAEGYLELSLPHLALGALDRIQDPGSFKGHKLWLLGEALRELARYDEGAAALEEASDLQPSNVPIYLALGWCYKRLNRLDAAIGALQRARDVASDQAIVHYNLACYYSLAHNKAASLESLTKALAIDPEYREKVNEEPDFDPLRGDADFQALTSIIV